MVSEEKPRTTSRILLCTVAEPNRLFLCSGPPANPRPGGPPAGNLRPPASESARELFMIRRYRRTGRICLARSVLGKRIIFHTPETLCERDMIYRSRVTVRRRVSCSSNDGGMKYTRPPPGGAYFYWSECRRCEFVSAKFRRFSERVSPFSRMPVRGTQCSREDRATRTLLRSCFIDRRVFSCGSFTATLSSLGRTKNDISPRHGHMLRYVFRPSGRPFILFHPINTRFPVGRKRRRRSRKSRAVTAPQRRARDRNARETHDDNWPMTCAFLRAYNISV